MESEPHDKFMGFELRRIPQHDDDCARYGYEVKLPVDGQWHEVDSYTLRWDRQEALEGLVKVLSRVMKSQMKECERLIVERDDARDDQENSRQSLAFALEELDGARRK